MTLSSRKKYLAQHPKGTVLPLSAVFHHQAIPAEQPPEELQALKLVANQQASPPHLLALELVHLLPSQLEVPTSAHHLLSSEEQTELFFPLSPLGSGQSCGPRLHQLTHLYHSGVDAAALTWLSKRSRAASLGS